MQESKHDRFKRVATKRINEVIEKLRILGNCADKRNYEYTNEDVEKIFSEINKQVKKVRSKFVEEEKTFFKL